MDDWRRVERRGEKVVGWGRWVEGRNGWREGGRVEGELA